MRRRILLYLTLLVLSGCRLDELHDDAVQSEGRAFSVGQAKEFFEKDFAEQLTKSVVEDVRSVLHPGDFTPQWDRAVYSESDGVAAYDVDILADRSIVAIRSKFGPEGARAERLPVYQKLVVRCNVRSGKMASYVLSLIPDVGCDDSRIPKKFRSRGSENGGFSGIAVYTTPDRGLLVRVREYQSGVRVRGVYIPSGQGSYVDRCRRASEIFGGMVLLSRSNVRTRSGEDYYGGELDESVCTGNLPPQGEGKGDEEDEDPPVIDDVGGGGDVELPEDDLIEGGVPEDEEQEAVNQKAQVIIQNLGNQIGTVKVGLSVSVGTPQGSPFGGFSFSTRDIFEKTQNYTITIAPGLSDVQQNLVLAHEFMHLKLLQISQNAGSTSALAQSNPELLGAMNRHGGVNEGHHFYMGQHIEEMEQLLRDAFPGQSEEFYEYGKWGGGAFNSDAFRQLPVEEQNAIWAYLGQLGL